MHPDQRRPVFAIVTLATFTACASTRNSTASREATGPTDGTYEFIASVTGRRVEGKVHIVGDTMLFDPDNDCSSNLSPPGIFVAPRDYNFIRYSCNGVVLDFDRRNPVQSSKWFAGVPVRRQRQVCAQYAVQNGRQVCVRNRTETYETTESRSGKLQVARRGS
jgi:hypothetical protein